LADDDIDVMAALDAGVGDLLRLCVGLFAVFALYLILK
jgi:hypothetical protein